MKNFHIHKSILFRYSMNRRKKESELFNFILRKVSIRDLRFNFNKCLIALRQYNINRFFLFLFHGTFFLSSHTKLIINIYKEEEKNDLI